MITPINSVNFKSVYRIKDKRFSAPQFSISEMLKNRIQSRYYVADSGNSSYDKYLEMRGYDAIMEPVENDKVKLSIVKGLKIDDETKEAKYNKIITIGDYCIESDFNPVDIKDKLALDSFKSTHMIAPLIMFVGLLSMLLVKSCHAEQKAKQIIENKIHADSIKKTTIIEYKRN